MTDDLEIRSGGMVAVDPDDLEQAARTFERIGADGDAAAGAMRAAAEWLAASEEESADVTALAARAESVAALAREVAGALRDAALLYAYADLIARRAVASGADAARIDAELARIRRDHPELDIPVQNALARRWLEGNGFLQFSGVASVWAAPLFPLLALAPLSTQLTVDAVGRGVITRADRLTGSSGPIVVQQTRREPSSAPASLGSALARVPGSTAQVRVEKYTMPDGTRSFAVYVSGTRELVSPREPWDMESNRRLYTGSRSDSYDGTLAALRAAGARPGDTVHAVGHSQGGMIVSRLATEGEYDVATLVAVGAPVEAVVGEDTLSVVLRHRDDPVAALAAGGSGAAVGAPDSIVAERTSGETTLESPLGAHHLTEYVETAEMIDDSADPRVDALREVFADLGRATEVEATEYSVQRRG